MTSPLALGQPQLNDLPSHPASTIRGPVASAAARVESAWSRRLDGSLFVVFLAALAWTPFWFGSNRTLAWGVNAAVFGGLAVLYEIGLLVTRRRHPVGLRRIWFPALAIFCVCGWMMLQAAPGAPPDLEHPIWRMAREALGPDLQGSISINRDATLIALLRFAAACLAFWVSLQLCRSSRRARRLVEGVAVVAALYAVYGVVAFFVFPKTTLWFEKDQYLDSVTSTFVNRNSYATYAGLGLICALALAINIFLKWSETWAVTRGQKVASLASLMIGQGGAWFVCVFLSGVALVLTGSRGGVAATLTAFLMLLILSGMRGRRNAVGSGFGLLGGGLVVALAVFNFSDFLADRLNRQGFESEDRLAVYSLIQRSIADAPLRGQGDGAFRQVFPMYRDASIGFEALWDKAHNSYLEAIQGLGAPVAALLFLAVAWLAIRCIYAALTRRNASTAPLAASAATILVLLHAFVDFSLQIQAVSLTWAALLGAGVAQSWSSRMATDG